MAITLTFTDPRGTQSWMVVPDARHGILISKDGTGTAVPPGQLSRYWVARYLVPHVRNAPVLVRDRCLCAAQGLGWLELME